MLLLTSTEKVQTSLCIPNRDYNWWVKSWFLLVTGKQIFEKSLVLKRANIDPRLHTWWFIFDLLLWSHGHRRGSTATTSASASTWDLRGKRQRSRGSWSSCSPRPFFLLYAPSSRGRGGGATCGLWASLEGCARQPSRFHQLDRSAAVLWARGALCSGGESSLSMGLRNMFDQVASHNIWTCSSTSLESRHSISQSTRGLSGSLPSLLRVLEEICWSGAPSWVQRQSRGGKTAELLHFFSFLITYLFSYYAT